MMLNIRNVAKNVMYSIVHSIGIIWGIKGYLYSITSVWHSDVI